MHSSSNQANKSSQPFNGLSLIVLVSRQGGIPMHASRQSYGPLSFGVR